jgi:hypothetical protein
MHQIQHIVGQGIEGGLSQYAKASSVRGVIAS